MGAGTAWLQVQGAPTSPANQAGTRKIGIVLNNFTLGVSNDAAGEARVPCWLWLV